MNILFANDTSSYHCGCNLTSELIIKELKKYGVVTNILLCPSFAVNIKSWINCNLDNVDIVIINGEGTFHSNNIGARNIYSLAQKAKKLKKKVCLINTVIDKITFDLSIFDFISCRESTSAQNKYHIAHDMCFKYKHENKSDGDYILVTDGIRHNLSNIYANIKHKKRYIQFNDKIKYNEMLDIYDNAKLIITARYHGAVFAVLKNKPFYAFESNTHKVGSMLADFNLSNRLVKSEISEQMFNYSPPNVSILNINNNIDNMFSKCFNG